MIAVFPIISFSSNSLLSDNQGPDSLISDVFGYMTWKGKRGEFQILCLVEM